MKIFTEHNLENWLVAKWFEKLLIASYLIVDVIFCIILIKEFFEESVSQSNIILFWAISMLFSAIKVYFLAKSGRKKEKHKKGYVRKMDSYISFLIIYSISMLYMLSSSFYLFVMV